MARHRRHKALAKVDVYVKLGALHVSLRNRHDLVPAELLAPDLLFVGLRSAKQTNDFINHRFSVAPILRREDLSHVLHDLLSPLRVVVLKARVVCLGLLLVLSGRRLLICLPVVAELFLLLLLILRP